MIKETTVVTVEKTWESETAKLQDQTNAIAFLPTTFATTMLSGKAIIDAISMACPRFKKALDELKKELSDERARITVDPQDDEQEQSETVEPKEESTPAEETEPEEFVTLRVPAKAFKTMTDVAEQYRLTGGEHGGWAADVTCWTAKLPKYVVK